MPLSTVSDRTHNLADALLAPHRVADRRERLAYKDDRGEYTFGELDDRVNQMANLFARLGLRREDRVMLCLYDRFEWVAVFLGAIKAGLVPIPTNTLLTAEDYNYLLADSRADALIVESELFERFQTALAQAPCVQHVLTSGDLASLADAEVEAFEAVATYADEPAFWQYSSGTTGAPKGVIHLHGGLRHCADLYAKQVLDLTEHDRIYSAARLFFGYGMGNSLAFPLATGAACILYPGRPTPEAVADILRREQPTVFFGVPTLYASLLASKHLPTKDQVALRLCISAGEALPPDVGVRWRERFGVDIVEGLGSTEMLHIFISNRPGAVRYGSIGKPTPGYQVRLIGEDGALVSPGDIGELQIRGPTSAAGYWAQRDKSQETFLGPWTRSADRCIETPDGDYIFVGRSDDLLKVGGIYVSPTEIEAALIEHPAVLEAAVVGRTDDVGLIKPCAYVVLKYGHEADDACAASIQGHVRTRLAPYKYPRWVYFEDELPKTATGKIQRFLLRHRI